MRTYTITGPDGKDYSIDGPEGASREQVIAKIQERLGSQMPAVQPRDPYTELAQKQTIGQNLLAGMGGGVHGLILGAKQLLGKATKKEIDDHKAAMKGLRSTTSGTIGDVLGQISAAVPLSMIPGANTYAGSALIGGGLGALQPTGENDSRTENMTLGALGGAAGKYVGDKLIGLLKGRGAGLKNQQALYSPEQTAGLNPAQREVLKEGQRLGFKSTPGVSSGSKSLQKFEAALESNPFTSGAFEDIKTHNAKVLNKISAGAIGENSDYVNSTILEQAKDRISEVYKRVADTRDRAIPAQDFSNKFKAIVDEFEGLLPANLDENPVVKRLIDFAQSGKATGEQLQTIASKLGNIAAKNMTTQGGDRDMGMALFRVKDMADDYLRSGLNAETAKAFDEARKQYRNLMLLTGRSGVVNSASGDVSKLGLANVLQSKDKAGYVMGKNKSDFYNAARFGDAFRPVVGDSGTATRSMSNLSLENLAKLPFGLVMRLYTAQPTANMIGGLAHIGNQGLAPGLGQLMAPVAQKTLPLYGGQVGATANRQDQY